MLKTFLLSFYPMITVLRASGIRRGQTALFVPVYQSHRPGLGPVNGEKLHSRRAVRLIPDGAAGDPARCSAQDQLGAGRRSAQQPLLPVSRKTEPVFRRSSGRAPPSAPRTGLVVPGRRGSLGQGGEDTSPARDQRPKAFFSRRGRCQQRLQSGGVQRSSKRRGQSLLAVRIGKKHGGAGSKRLPPPAPPPRRPGGPLPGFGSDRRPPGQ